MTVAPITIDAEPERVEFVVERHLADRLFRAGATAAASTTFVLMGLIGGFLLFRGLDALRDAGWGFFTVSDWQPDLGGAFGIAAVLPYTIAIAVVALTIAVPVSILAALFITEYAPRPLRRALTTTIDLLAAVPSLIYGLWGLFALQPRIISLSRWLADHLGFVPIFDVAAPQPRTLSVFPSSTFIAGVVVSLMVIPICTSVMREVFSQAPVGEKEGALALGATRLGVVRTVVLPFGRGGIVGGSMLGLGRALGETIAVTLIISPAFVFDWSILQQGSNSIASLIALKFSESSEFGISALMAAGLALFVLTLGVNAVASMVVSRSRSGEATEI
ncbi:MAG TPA: phosphate ABC transporter permease subunit PstC [Acidimicrobiia bacterium]|nr:phosphate ABC transporter permease subunit PstC [Acidimicrobiia bacterium]